MADIKRWDGTSGYPILKLNEASDFAAVSKSEAFTVELTGGDYKTVILMTGTSGKKVTFSVGNGIQGAGSDLEVKLASANTHAIVLDSGYFKNVNGTDKDCVKIAPEAATSFIIFELPQ